MTKLVYIGGYGHSGSTLLEYLMTASPQVITCGEVASLRHQRSKTRKCSCGRLAEACSVWSRFFNPSLDLDHWSHEDLDLALLQHISKDRTIMVDSSKTAWRHAAAPFRLRHKLGQDFFLVHVVRDPRAVCWSLIRRSKRIGEQPNNALLCAATALGWWFANLACELFGRRYPDQYHRVRYEDLARSPREVLAGLWHKVLPNGELRFEAIGTSDNRHQLFGNRMRSQRLSLADIKEDDAWRTSMPIQYRRLVRNLCWVLYSRYGYP